VTNSAIHPTAVVADDATLGAGVSIGAFSVVGAGVILSAGVVVGTHCVLGEPTMAILGGAPPKGTRIGRDSLVRSHTVIYDDVEIGDDFRSGHRVTIREGARIGQDVQVGTLSDLQGDQTIGNHVRLHSNVFIAQLSAIEEYVWIFPHVVLTNDPHPPSDTCTKGATVRHHAVIATHATILPGIELGAGSLVGAMSLVSRSVEAGRVVAGVPATDRGPTTSIRCREGVLDQPYPWERHFSRGYVVREPGDTSASTQ
jgi:acetyltransferase-like isoleucine patch superfamily enzyme